jgi:NADH-quinone oxidoreductase subunit K
MPGPLLSLAVLLFIVGLVGALLRRSLLVALLSLQLAMAGAVLAFVAFAVPADDAGGAARAVVVVCLAVVHAIAGAATSIAVFRRRATVNLDELRELRG